MSRFIFNFLKLFSVQYFETTPVQNYSDKSTRLCGCARVVRNCLNRVSRKENLLILLVRPTGCLYPKD